MSASTEKKNRRIAREQGLDKKVNAAQEQAAQKAKNKRNWTIVSVIVAILIVAVLVANTGFYYNTTTAMEVNGKTYSPADVNYRYASQYVSFLNTYGNYISLTGLDTSGGIGGLATQPCSWLNEGEGETWKDYFMLLAKDSMKQTAALVAEAEAQGMSLDDTDKATVDEQLAYAAIEAKNYGFSNLDKYFKACYGNGVTEKIVRAALEESILANKAITAKQDEITGKYTADDFSAYYEENLKDSADIMDYAQYFVAAEKIEQTTADENGEEVTESVTTEETMAAAKENAEAIVAAFKEGKGEYFEAFDAAVSSVIPDATASHNENVTASSVSTYFKDWLVSADRAAGDVEIFDNPDYGYYVVVYIGRTSNDYNTVNIRHILFMAEADENGEYTDEALAAAKTKAEEALALFESGDKTEDSFAALAEEMSEDTGSASNGGLYENVTKGQMVEEFDAFCFDDARKPGDTGIVYGNNGGYAGYHVMYYAGQGEVYRDMLAKNEMVSNELNEWVASISEDVTVTDGSGIKYVG